MANLVSGKAQPGYLEATNSKASFWVVSPDPVEHPKFPGPDSSLRSIDSPATFSLAPEAGWFLAYSNGSLSKSRGTPEKSGAAVLPQIRINPKSRVFLSASPGAFSLGEFQREVATS